MKNYGLTGYQIKQAKNKLEFNKEFMRNNGVHIDNKTVPFSDFVQNSYFNSDRYIAELQHRAWSIYDYAKEKSLKNVFFTLTLPSKWHPSKTFKNKLIKNKKFAGRKYICTIKKIKFLNARVIQNIPFIEPILDFSQTIDKYSPRNASKELSKMLKKFFFERSYRNIDKNQRCYFRVTEPHKDGTPHIHMSLFVPADSVPKIVKSLQRLFPAPLGKIETEVNSPVHYLMKYILKTLDDLRDENSEVSSLTLWYLYHGISRFYTSRTFVSLEVYRRLNGMYKLQELTEKFQVHDVSVYVYSGTNKICLIENEFGTIYVPKPVNWAQKQDLEDRTNPENNTVQIESGFETIYKNTVYKPFEMVINGKLYTSYIHLLKQLNADNDLLRDIGISPMSLNSILVKKTIKPYQMNDFELYEYFENLDIDTVDEKHYYYTHNLMIDRGLLEGEWLKLTSLDEINQYFKSEVF